MGREKERAMGAGARDGGETWRKGRKGEEGGVRPREEHEDAGGTTWREAGRGRTRKVKEKAGKAKE